MEECSRIHLLIAQAEYCRNIALSAGELPIKIKWTNPLDISNCAKLLLIRCSGHQVILRARWLPHRTKEMRSPALPVLAKFEPRGAVLHPPNAPKRCGQKSTTLHEQPAFLFCDEAPALSLWCTVFSPANSSGGFYFLPFFPRLTWAPCLCCFTRRIKPGYGRHKSG